MRRFLNVFPPFAGSSIHVDRISEDWREIDVRLSLRPWSRNYVGTQFGGSLFMMSDPFWMIGVLKNLGEKDHVVWDSAGEIDFVSPGREDVFTQIRITDELLDDIRGQVADGEKHLVWCHNDIVNKQGELIARHRKQLYIRRKR